MPIEGRKTSEAKQDIKKIESELRSLGKECKGSGSGHCL